ncbi:alpha/beta hydrolase-fold protein [Actinoplanes sp. NPDC051851]|uniref:alpha/beta hydrolase n=1 Tax=Actinoplanes sp. NPDC051851 TaxID=3154753 RepID=UPI00342A9EDE
MLSFASKLIGADVPYDVITPDGWTPDERLPLVLVLHGANSSAAVLGMMRPLATSLPRSLIACASTPTVGGFYLGAWERLIADEFPALLTAEYHADPSGIALLGASMGGYGALKIAFADPSRFTAVAAVSPALLPAMSYTDLRPRNTMSVLAQLATEMEAAGWPAESVAHRARSNAAAIRAAGLPIMLRCGDHDVFNMHDGTEHLHRTLWDLDIPHDYHLVRDADHIGPESASALRSAFAFLSSRTPIPAPSPEWEAWSSSDRSTPPPPLDPTSPTAASDFRVLFAPTLSETAHADPTATRRYGPLP